jgi:putative FmdB family regulatory protein
MPIYEYLCTPCQEKFTYFLPSIHATPQPVCPRCGGQEVRKLVSAFAVLSGERGGADEEESAPPPRPVLGRKEIQQAEEIRRRAWSDDED